MEHVVGELAAWAAALPSRWHVHLEPDFEGPPPGGRGRIDWSVAPVAVLWPVATFLGAPVVWRAAWEAWRARAASRHA